MTLVKSSPKKSVAQKQIFLVPGIEENFQLVK